MRRRELSRGGRITHPGRLMGQERSTNISRNDSDSFPFTWRELPLKPTDIFFLPDTISSSA